MVVLRFLEMTTVEWSSLLEQGDCPYGPINSIEQAFNDPQVRTVVALKIVSLLFSVVERLFVRGTVRLSIIAVIYMNWKFSDPLHVDIIRAFRPYTTR